MDCIFAYNSNNLCNQYSYWACTLYMHWALLLERRRSQAVNDARLWSRKSPEGRDINLKTEISLSTQQHMVTFFGQAVNGNFFSNQESQKGTKGEE